MAINPYGRSKQENISDYGQYRSVYHHQHDQGEKSMKNKVHLLFEQSGTFKKEFKKLGYDAKDYDIRNDFNETDEVIDLFNEIEKAYCYRDSIFDNFKKGELVMAFFPCIRFEDQIQMHFRGTAAQYKNYTEEQKLQNDMKLHKELQVYQEV